MHTERYRRYRTRLAGLVAELAPGGGDDQLVLVLSAVLDGLWREHSAGDATNDPDRTITTCLAMIDRWLDAP